METVSSKNPTCLKIAVGNTVCSVNVHSLLSYETKELAIEKLTRKFESVKARKLKPQEQDALNKMVDDIFVTYVLQGEDEIKTTVTIQE